MTILSVILGRIFSRQDDIPQSAPAEPVDIDVVLDALAAEKAEPLNWRTSIVDLLKVLDIDSSLDARRDLARDMGCIEAADDTAAMNAWLHRQVMDTLAQNGGKVPDAWREDNDGA
jgi:hypothetical protein